MNTLLVTRQTAFAALLSTTTLLAQSITITAVADGDVVVSAGSSNGPTHHATAPNGQNVSNGLLLNAIPTATMTSRAQTSFQVFQSPSSVGASLRSFGWTNSSAPHLPFARTGISQILVQVTLSQPMTLDLSFHASVIACSSAPTGRAWVDIDNDGTIDLQATPGATLFGFANQNLILAMPAGTTELVLGTELDLPAIKTLGRANETMAGFSIQPAHATVTWEGTGCGAQLDAVPMLNGDVRFWVAGQQLGDLPFLVFGSNRHTQPFPITPGCNLLVTPDIIKPMTAWSYEHVPLSGLSGQLFVQGAILRPQAIFLSSAGLFATQRVAMTLQ